MESEAFNPLRDHLLLQKIFSNLTLSEIKVSRLVCRNWGEEGALNFRHRALNIQLNPVHMTYRSRMTKDNLVVKEGRVEERRALRDFLTTYKLSHTLHLSLLGFHPWLKNTPYFRAYNEEDENGKRHKLYIPFYQQENNLRFGRSLLSNYFFSTAPFIKELRLELMLKQDQDFKMLERILKALETSLDRCSLDFVVLKNNILQQSQLTKNHKLSKIQTLAISLRFDGDKAIEWLLHPGPTTLLSLFPNISFLDLIGWRKYYTRSEMQTVDKTTQFLDAAMELELKLDGIHAAPRTYRDFQAILNYCAARPLKFLHLHIIWREADSWAIISFIEGIIRECEETLERFDLTWRVFDAAHFQQLQLPFLKKLKSLTYVSKYLEIYEPSTQIILFQLGNLHLERQWIEGEVLRECIGFKELFSDYGKILNSKFPALESLSLILVEPGEERLWAEIFPPENDGKCISSKIKTLVLTFAGECESQEIQKFPLTLFPKLRQFRHGKWRENGNKLFVCHHEYDSDGRLIRKWSWLAAIKNFRGRPFEPGARDEIIQISECGNYFHTIREKFRIRLGDYGFWDTGYDLEAD